MVSKCVSYIFWHTLPLDLIPLTRHPKQTTQERRRQRVMSHLISPILPGSVSAYVKFDKPTGTSLPSTASADLAVKARSIPRTALSKNCWLEDWHRLFVLFTSPMQLHVGVCVPGVSVSVLLCAKQNSFETMSPSTPLKATVLHLMAFILNVALYSPAISLCGTVAPGHCGGE